MFQTPQDGPIPYAMPPTEADVILSDISNQMAHAQMLRRLSGNSSTNHTGNRRKSVKVLKANSVGNSPHSCHIQRRKTTTAQPTRPTHPNAQDRYQARGQKMGSNYTSRRQVAQGRPMSWHPGSRHNETAAKTIPSSGLNLRNTIAGLETLAVAEDHIPSDQISWEKNMTIPPTQPFQENNSTLYPQCYSNRAPAISEQQLASMEGYQHLMAGNHTTFSSYPLYDVPDLTQDFNPPLPYGFGYEQYASAGMQASDWAHLSSNIDNYPIPQTPDFLPIQNPAGNLENTIFPTMKKKKSSELVGMGLYDNIERNCGQASSNLASLRGESTGKGLKLEETWQPPKEDEEDEEDEEEISSADEAEDDVPVSFAQDEPQPALYPPYGDLSNQSFFFDNDDQYPNCIAFDQAMQVCQPKVPDPVIENSLWF